MRPMVPGSGTEVILADVEGEWSGETGAGVVERQTISLPIILPTAPSERYVIERALAQGGMGFVRVARDLTLQRRVAIKVLNPDCPIPGAAARFLEEARITAQLQHPSIVAVYEIGVAADGLPFFTMQLIEGQTLSALVAGLRTRDPSVLRQFGRARLLHIFIQVCNAVGYAHSRGVIHRDLKPENIMLGAFGEVFVMDWGLAKIVTTDVPEPVVGGRPTDDRAIRTRIGDVTGTPSYMPPEQAMGLVDALNARSDIYALGALLYELLTLEPPHGRGTTAEVLRRARNEQPVPPSVVVGEAAVPAELCAVVMRCLEREQSERFESTAALVDEIEAFISGGQTMMVRKRGAARTVREASREATVFKELSRRRRQAGREAQEAVSQRLPADPPAFVAGLWAACDAAERLDAEVHVAFDTAVALYLQAISEAPENVLAHEGLRDLYWYRFLESERLDDRPAMALFRGLAAQHDPNFALRLALLGEGGLTLTSDPPGATVTLFRYATVDRRAVPVEPRDCGTTPLSIEPLPMGSYLVVLESDRDETLHLSLSIGRQEHLEVEVGLVSRGRTPNGLVYVPGGLAFLGAAEPELQAPQRCRVRIEPFLIGVEPVTVGEYAEFDGRSYPPMHGRHPVTDLTARDARAYCEWREARDGLPWRLPTETEWEFAARGADGRAYPWGDTWEPSFCRCLDGLDGGVLAPVGNLLDEGPFGARDLAGGVREWTATAHPRDARRRVIKGGGFLSSRAACHLGARTYAKIDRGATDVGFRLALDAAALKRRR